MDRAKFELFLPYQRAWIQDESPLKVWEKGRRTGASWTEAFNSVYRALGKSEGRNTYYLSYNKDMTRQFIRDCVFWAKALDGAAREVEEEISIVDEKQFTVYRLPFVNGREIAALPGVAYAIRSKQGRVVLDEAAFTPEFEEIKKAALALLIWSGSFSVISTHNGEDSPFNLLLKEIREGREKGWSVHRVSFREAVTQGLYRRICVLKGWKWAAKKEKEWVAKIYEIYKGNAEEELDVIPSRGGTKYFPYGMLCSCAAGIPVIRLDCPDSFMWDSPEKRHKEIERWFNVEAAPLLRAVKGPVYPGQDFARSGNLSVIWISEEKSKSELATRMIIELNNVPYDQQWQILGLISRACNVGYMAIDSRGNGQALAEAAAQRLPCGAAMVMITRAWYAGVFQRLKSRLESREFIIPNDPFIMSDFALITLQDGKPVVPKEESPDRKEGGGKARRHGDAAVAAAMSLYAWEEGSASAPPVFASTGCGIDTLFFGY